MKKALIITWYWPPAGGTGTQRCLKFARHLRDYGWEPVIFTAGNRHDLLADYSTDTSGTEDLTILETKAWDPYRFYRFFTGRSKSQAASPHLSLSEKQNLREQFSRWVRDNLFIPDARISWVKPSVKFLREYLQTHQTDIIFTSGPPHSTHLIGLALKKQNPALRWVADFRDPWMHIRSYHHDSMSKSAFRKQKALEAEVIANADAVIAVGNQLQQELLEANENRDPEKFYTITNSFEKTKKENPVRRDTAFIITHSGTLYKNRSPLALWKCLGELVKEHPAFREKLQIRLVGKTEAEVLAAISNCGLAPFVHQTGLLPHAEAREEIRNSDLLLVLVNDVPDAGGILTGKFFEYLGSGIPILAIGPEDGDLAAIIRETNCGRIAGFQNEKQIRKLILDFFEKKIQTGSAAAEKYSAAETTRELAAVFEKISGRKN